MTEEYFAEDENIVYEPGFYQLGITSALCGGKSEENDEHNSQAIVGFTNVTDSKIKEELKAIDEQAAIPDKYILLLAQIRNGINPKVLPNRYMLRLPQTYKNSISSN